MVDITEFLTEISSDSPCGENLEYDSARIALDTNILGTPENQFSGEKAIPPNWRDVQKEALALLHRSKDLQVMLYLIRALIHQEGIQGFRDSLFLLEQSVSLFWDDIHPRLDPDDGMDPTLRVNIIEELVSSELVLLPLSLQPMVESRTVGRFCLRDYQYATDKLPVPEHITKPDINAIKAAFLDVELESLNQTHTTIIELAEIVGRLDGLVAEKVGGANSVNLQALTSLIKELRFAFEQLAGSRLSALVDTDGNDETSSDDVDSSQKGSTKNIQPFVAGKLSTRHDVLNALDSICKYYAEYEPSSPVPVLLERAKYLVSADFMAIVQNMFPDALGQLEMIKGPDPNQSS
jgi:type VI secretion system protein ImpA